jgi:hypothetical protein
VLTQPADDVTARFSFKLGAISFNRRAGRFVQTVTLTNISAFAIDGPISLVLDDLSPGVSLVKPFGVTKRTGQLGSPYLHVVPAGGSLGPGQSVTVVLEFDNPNLLSIHYKPRVLAGPGER